MNKKILGIGILVILVAGLIALGASLKRPSQELPIDAQQQPLANTPTETQAPKPAPKAPPKATAKPTTSVAALKVAPEEIALDLSTEFARIHEAQLQPFIKNDPDFDGHYIVAKWGCDSNCVMGAVIDKRNGKVYPTPIEHPGHVEMNSDFVFYSLNTNQYRIINDGHTETYAFDGRYFTLVSTGTI